MNRYEQAFETDWEYISPEEASVRAYAIGVAETMGENNQHHLLKLLDAMETGYSRSLVELAYQEGRADATKRDQTATRDDIWESLVGSMDAPAQTSDRREHVPDALALFEALNRQQPDSRDALAIPDFLSRDRSVSTAKSDNHDGSADER